MSSINGTGYNLNFSAYLADTEDPVGPETAESGNSDTTRPSTPEDSTVPRIPYNFRLRGAPFFNLTSSSSSSFELGMPEREGFSDQEFQDDSNLSDTEATDRPLSSSTPGFLDDPDLFELPVPVFDNDPTSFLNPSSSSFSSALDTPERDDLFAQESLGEPSFSGFKPAGQPLSSSTPDLFASPLSVLDNDPEKDAQVELKKQAYREYQKAYREKNKEKKRESNRAYRKSQTEEAKEKKRESNRAYRERRKDDPKLKADGKARSAAHHQRHKDEPGYKAKRKGYRESRKNNPMFKDENSEACRAYRERNKLKKLALLEGEESGAAVIEPPQKRPKIAKDNP